MVEDERVTAYADEHCACIVCFRKRQCKLDVVDQSVIAHESHAAHAKCKISSSRSNKMIVLSVSSVEVSDCNKSRFTLLWMPLTTANQGFLCFSAVEDSLPMIS